jgi:uncharacterized protein DUF4956
LPSEWFREALNVDVPTLPVLMIRLLAALAGGYAVAFIYRRATRAGSESQSFLVTLVLLTVLIAMVTQVIGDNVARAFSLVGALSIVRFRTVVRDTQDTAYVIFAVAVGMAMGANHPAVAIGGVVIVGIAAASMRGPALASTAPPDRWPYRLTVRLALGLDPIATLGPTFKEFLTAERLASVSTARQGTAIEVTYGVTLRDEQAAVSLVNALNRLDGVQAAAIEKTEERQEG